MSAAVRSGYKQTEVGVIPEDWEARNLGEICDLQVGYAFKSAWFQDYGGVPLLRGENVGYGSPDWSLTKMISLTNAVEHEDYLLSPGDVIIGMDRTFSKSGAKISLVAQSDCPSLLVQRVGRFIPRKCEGSFLHVLLSAVPVQAKLRLAQKGMDIPHLSRSEILSPKVAVPPLPEQRAIATALSDVDALLAKLNALVAKKRDLKVAAMQQLLTGQTRLPGFSGEWEVRRLGDVSPLQRGFDLLTSRLRPGSYPVVYSNGVSSYHDEFMVKGPGVVTGRSGTIGNVHFVEGDFWPHNTSLWVTSFKGNSPKFIFYLLTSLGLDRFGTGSGVPTLNRNDVHAHSVFIPPTAKEQTAIATILSDMDTELTALEARRDKTRAIKQGMMQELLTGRIRLI